MARYLLIQDTGPSCFLKRHSRLLLLSHGLPNPSPQRKCSTPHHLNGKVGEVRSPGRQSPSIQRRCRCSLESIVLVSRLERQSRWPKRTLGSELRVSGTIIGSTPRPEGRKEKGESRGHAVTSNRFTDPSSLEPTRVPAADRCPRWRARRSTEQGSRGFRGRCSMEFVPPRSRRATRPWRLETRA